ncbi:hypothetical protein BVRB_4g092880 [Beta vulgaris subsp. vulgaris]|nr:hypothetical protein BVRB_4g092880 [Beta vulgaris subsp. vulgaris]
MSDMCFRCLPITTSPTFRHRFPVGVATIWWSIALLSTSVIKVFLFSIGDWDEFNGNFDNLANGVLEVIGDCFGINVVW